jgi:hypothetical protein
MLAAVGGGPDAFSFTSERNLFLPIQTPDISKLTPKRSSDIPYDLKQQLLDNYREDLISLSFNLIHCKYLYLSEEYLRQSASKSPMVLHSMHALGSLVSSPNTLPQGVSTRPELANVYFEKALTFFAMVITNPNEQGVLSLFLLALAALKMDRGNIDSFSS